MMLKNENQNLKELAKKFVDRYSICNYSSLDVILFIRRLNNMGYLVVKDEDIRNINQEIKYIIPWMDEIEK